MKRFVVRLESETAALATQLATVFRPGDSVALSGDLGAGKTTFVRFVVAAMGGDSKEVSSPSFTLQHEYRLPSGLSLEHWDLYRLRETPDDLREPPAQNVIRLIEWPERCPGLKESMTIRCSFTLRPDGARDLEISAVGEPSRLAAVSLSGAR